MSRGSIRIGRLAGIPIGVQPLWLMIVALITWSLGAAYCPSQVSGIAPALALRKGPLIEVPASRHASIPVVLRFGQRPITDVPHRRVWELSRREFDESPATGQAVVRAH